MTWHTVVSFVSLSIAWHSRFNKRIEKKHPNIWTFINVLKDEEVHFRQQLIHANTGKLKKNSERTCVMQSKLLELRKRYDERGIQLPEYHHQLSLLVGTTNKWFYTSIMAHNKVIWLLFFSLFVYVLFMLICIVILSNQS